MVFATKLDPWRYVCWKLLNPKLGRFAKFFGIFLRIINLRKQQRSEHTSAAFRWRGVESFWSRKNTKGVIRCWWGMYDALLVRLRLNYDFWFMQMWNDLKRVETGIAAKTHLKWNEMTNVNPTLIKVHDTDNLSNLSLILEQILHLLNRTSDLMLIFSVWCFNNLKFHLFDCHANYQEMIGNCNLSSMMANYFVWVEPIIIWCIKKWS